MRNGLKEHESLSLLTKSRENCLQGRVAKCSLPSVPREEVEACSSRVVPRIQSKGISVINWMIRKMFRDALSFYEL